MAREEEPKTGEDDWLAAAASGGPRTNTLSSSRPIPPSARKPALERPGGWLTAALASGDITGASSRDGDDEGREEGKVTGTYRGDGGKHVAVETVSVGVQWEEGESEAVGAPSSSTTGGLPPWAKPYARSVYPSIDAVDDDGVTNETDGQVTMESSGIQCGESVLGG